MIVVDTNVILRGFRSRSGACGWILEAMLSGEIAFAASPAVILEYEDVLKRADSLAGLGVGFAEVDMILDALCYRAVEAHPWFRFRPFLTDPKDDLFIECALAAGAGTIVTDDAHFRNPDVAAFGLVEKTAAAFVADWRREGRPK